MLTRILWTRQLIAALVQHGMPLQVSAWGWRRVWGILMAMGQSPRQICLDSSPFLAPLAFEFRPALMTQHGPPSGGPFLFLAFHKRNPA